MSADENTDGIGDQAENEDGPSAVDTNDVNDGNTGDETENEDATSTVDTDKVDEKNTCDETENENIYSGTFCGFSNRSLSNLNLPIPKLTIV